LYVLRFFSFIKKAGLRYGQYGQVGADGVWQSKDADSNTNKGDTLEYSEVKIPMDVELFAKLREHLREPRSRAELQEFCNIGSKDYF
jgi:hypothetical protein